jgi:hypothetical protein
LNYLLISHSSIMTDKTTPQHTSHWAKQLYYYAVLGFGILFVAIGLFIGVRSALVRYVFTSIDDNYYGYNQCDNNFGQNGTTPLSDTDRKTCLDRQEETRVKNVNNNFQKDTLTSIMMVLIAGTVIGLHTTFVKIKE